MIRFIYLLVATGLITVATFTPAEINANFRADQPVAEDRSRAFVLFDRLLLLLKDKTKDESAVEVRRALNKSESPWVAIAAVEAVRQAEVDSPGAGKPFLDDVIALMGKDHAASHEEQFYTINVLGCLGALADKGDPESLKVVRAIVEWQKWSKNEVIRLRDMADRVLFDLTGEDCTLNDKTLAFWEWWVVNEGRKAEEKAPEKQSRTAPTVFKEPIVGTRIVFVIDVSDSMKHDIRREDHERLSKMIPHHDWKHIRSWMDLAIAELVYSLEALEQEKEPKRRRRTSTEEDQTYPHFAIVTYSTDVELLTEGWVPAAKGDIKKWVREVKRLETWNTTNIHGALTTAMGLGSNGRVTERSALDNDCLLNGAHTIVFLTDGYPTWSDDSTDRTGKNQWDHAVGNGEHVKSDKLIELAATLNRFRKVVINTVGVGIHDKELMRRFAEDSGGVYTDWGAK